VTSVSDVLLDEELRHLRDICRGRGWNLETPLVLSLPSKSHGLFHLRIDLSDYPTQPPAFHWTDAEKSRLNDPLDTPTGGGYFHSSGRICAPWNRLAYQSVDAKGPHGDWHLAGWKANPLTGLTDTLPAMVLRVHHELQASCAGRMA
jgi:hypothetical protein